MRSLYYFLLALSAIAAAAAPGAALQSYVIPARLPPGNAVASTIRQVQLALGSGSSAPTVWSTVDTGSGFVDLRCNTPATGDPVPGVYTWTNTSATNVNETVCAAIGAGNCMSGGSCWWSSALTGGPTFNTYSGVVVQDTITMPGSLPALSVPNSAFGCAQSYESCARGAPGCPAALQSCPPPQTISKPSNSGLGIEFGFTFSAPSFPTQLVTRGMIDPVLALCYQPPAAASSCTPAASDGYVVMGRGRTPNTTVAQVPITITPISFETIDGPNSALSGMLFRTPVPNSTVAVFGGGVNTTLYSAGQYNVLWDSGAYGKLAVGPEAYGAYLSYFTAALQAYNTTSAGGAFQGQYQNCNAKQFCGDNFMASGNAQFPEQGPGSCIRLPVQDATNATQTAAALAALQLLYPPNITFGLAGGISTALPTANPIIDCAGSGVAVCSYPSDGYPWVAAPWFDGRWVQFDASAPMPGHSWSNGTMSFTPNTMPSCGFLVQTGPITDVTTSTGSVAPSTSRPSGAVGKGISGSAWIAGLAVLAGWLLG